MAMSKRQVALKHGFKSGLEKDVVDYLVSKGVDARYEEYAIDFVQPEKKRKYTPDVFVYNSKGELRYVIETKGRLTVEDRQKMQWVRDQHPDVEFRLLFQNDGAKLSKQSKTTYGKWSAKAKFLYSKFFSTKPVPDSWIADIENTGDRSDEELNTDDN